METIIFQETDPDILEVLYAALELEGYQVYAVQDCEPDFIEIIDKARPHVVMLDYRLSGEVCKAFCLAIKKHYPHLPVLALSCNSNINECYHRDGFDGYVEKPFDLDQLYSILRAHIPKQV